MNILFTLLNVFCDVMSDKTRKRITERDVLHHCDLLAAMVKQDYKPDIVVAIDTGGSSPGELVAQFIGIPVAHVVICRDIKIDRVYRLDPIPIRWIMSLYHHYLFRTVMPTISTTVPAVNLSGKRVLIVDDSIHTGATIDVAIAYLRKIGVRDVKVATLSYVSRKKPDYTVLARGKYSFPWSKDYRK